MEMKSITHSSKECFLECPYRYFLEYIRLLTPSAAAAPYLTWGQLVHAALGWMSERETMDTEGAVEALREYFEEHPEGVQIDLVDAMLYSLDKVLKGWQLKWAEKDKDLETVMSEVPFEMPLPSGYVFKGKIDRIVKDKKTGKLLLWEWKTPSRVIWQNYLLGGQGLGYVLGAREALGFDVDTIQYDFLLKPANKRQYETEVDYWERIGESVLLSYDKYFFRPDPLTYREEEIRRYKVELDDITQMIEFCRREGIFPKHHAANRFGKCAFERVCLYGDENGYFVRENFHPELESIHVKPGTDED